MRHSKRLTKAGEATSREVVCDTANIPASKLRWKISPKVVGGTLISSTVSGPGQTTLDGGSSIYILADGLAENYSLNVWHADYPYICSSGGVSTVLIKTTPSEAHIRAGDTNRLSVTAAIGNMELEDLAWTLSPELPNGARLQTSPDGAGGDVTATGIADVWLSPGGVATNYTLTASHRMAADMYGNPTIASTTRVDVIKFDLNRTRAAMKSHGPATNVFSVVSSDGQLADWEIASTGPIGYPTYIFDSLQAAENPFYSASLAGAGEVYVMPGAPLRTTVVATHPLYTNIAQTAELVVVDIELEPITTATNIFNQTINPSGVPTDGGFGNFRVAVEPAEWVPDADIEWLPYDPTSVSFWNGDSNGREVEMGLYNGALQTVSVEIKDLVHPAPEISFEGHSRKTIPVRFMVTCKDNGTEPAATSTQCTNWVREANAILDQVGIALALQSIAFTNRQEWYELDYYNVSDNTALRSSFSSGEGFEVYVK